MFAYIYLGIVKGVQCVRRGVCFYCHRFDTYPSVHRALPGFGFIFWVSIKSLYNENICVSAYLSICVYISKGIILPGQASGHLLADMKMVSVPLCCQHGVREYFYGNELLTIYICWLSDDSLIVSPYVAWHNYTFLGEQSAIAST